MSLRIWYAKEILAQLKATAYLARAVHAANSQYNKEYMIGVTDMTTGLYILFAGIRDAGGITCLYAEDMAQYLLSAMTTALIAYHRNGGQNLDHIAGTMDVAHALCHSYFVNWSTLVQTCKASLNMEIGMLMDEAMTAKYLDDATIQGQLRARNE